MRRRTWPVRLVAGALAILSIPQAAILASRRDAAPAPHLRTGSAPTTLDEAQVDLMLSVREPTPPASLAPPRRLVRLPNGVPMPKTSSPALRALRAALSVVGSPYVWAGASPSGFDCSGLTMWAWAHAGVTLPHSSRAQYGALPHVSREDLRPGDLVFFYSPISHVEMYLGHGLMVGALTSGSSVGIRPVFWDTYVGAARPG